MNGSSTSHLVKNGPFPHDVAASILPDVLDPAADDVAPWL